MPDSPLPASVAPQPIYYLLIDGTEPVDSAAFGGALERSFPSFKNLAEESFGRQELPPTLPFLHYGKGLQDLDHPKLPIWRYPDPVSKKGIAVVMPGGKGGYCNDSRWGLPEDRSALADESAWLAGDLLLKPQAGAYRDGGGPGWGFNANAPTRTAELVYVSSHGWLGGFMAGNAPHPMPMGNPPDTDWSAPPYFSVGSAVADKKGFEGPKWIVLAQCSTLNPVTWSLWAQVLAASSPGVRGILGYDLEAPDADPASDIAQNFIRNAAQMTLLEAWKSANAGRNWAAIVHKSAVTDEMRKWRSLTPIRNVSTSERESSYVGYASNSVRGGRPLRTEPEPFSLRLYAVEPDGPVEILPTNLVRRADFETGKRYRVRIEAPPGQITSVELTWVNIRWKLSRKEQYDVRTLFDWSGNPADLRFQSLDYPQPRPDEVPLGPPNKLVVSSASPRAAIEFDLIALNLNVAGLRAHHSYVWPRCSITGGESHDFSTRGLIYYG